MSARRIAALLAAGVLLSAGCSGSPDDAAALPPPPPIDASIDTDAAFPDDGLTRYIITPIASAGSDPAGEGAAGAIPGPVDTEGEDEHAAPPGAGDDDAAIRHLTAELMALVPDGASLAQRDGRIGYIDESGDFVALPIPDGSSGDGTDPGSAGADASTDQADEGEPPAAGSYGNPFVDELASRPGVVQVIVVGDGTYGVTVSDPSAIDPTIFTIAEDVPFGHTAERYEGYQWSLENDGESLRGVRAIDQVEDADLDIAPTVGRADGRGVVVAVIDSGVDFSHPDLAGSSWSNPGEVCGNSVDDDGNGYVDDCNGWDFGNGDPNPFDPGANPHGTHVAGIITADRNGQGVAGIAPGSLIMDLNVGSRSAAGESISGASITAAIRYAADNGADVINLSLGTEPGTPAAAVAPMGAAIDYAASLGVVVVAAAGNHGTDIGSAPVYPASFDKANMLVVGASTPSDTRAEFSNHGADIVDLYAPGELILSTMPGDDYQFMSGTSQASPTAAASVALIIESKPDASVHEVIDTVTATVDRRQALSTSVTSGRLNSARAIDVEGDTPIPTELGVTVSGLRQPDTDVGATVQIATPPDAFAEPYRWELSLLHSDDDGAYVVIDHPLTVAGSSRATDGNGAVELLAAEGAGVASVEVATQLPAGRYSFVVEAVPTADPTYRLGDAFVASFEIPGDPDDSIPITTSPATTRPEAPTSTTDGAVGDDTADTGSGGRGSTTQPESTSPTIAGDEPGSPTGSGTSRPTPTTPVTDGPGGDGTGGPGESSDATDEPGPGATVTGPRDDGGTETGSSTPDPGDEPPTTEPDSETGAGGSSTTPTTAPDTNGPADGGATTTSTTVADTTAPGEAGVPSGLGTGAAKKGAWESTSVRPRTGTVGEATTVQIAGNFPSSTYVWFGDQPGQVVFQDRSLITVRTPLRADPGVVDITLRKSHRGVVLTIPDAYAFVADDPADDSDGTADDGSDTGSDDDDQPGRDSDDSDTDEDDATDVDDDRSGGSSEDDDRPDDGTESDGGDAGEPDDGTGSDGGDGDGSTGDDGETAERSDRRSRMTVGSPVDLANGLLGAPVTPNLVAGVRACSTDPCPAVPR